MKQLSDEQIDDCVSSAKAAGKGCLTPSLIAEHLARELGRINNLETQPAAKSCEYNGGTCTRRGCVGQCQAMQLAQPAADDNAGGEPVAWVDVVDTHEGPYNFHGKELMPKGKHELYTRPQPQAIPAGYAIVPVVPTPEMLDAMQSSGWMIGNYRAMIAAAPKVK